MSWWYVSMLVACDSFSLVSSILLSSFGTKSSWHVASLVEHVAPWDFHNHFVACGMPLSHGAYL